jgi:hypothetical protein
VLEIHQTQGKKGLESLKDVGKSLAEEIEKQLQQIEETGEVVFEH